MYVRKFEADTLEEALRDIKQELGPDAIILKTMTNKGLKGAFKKKKIEITAAISEKNYSKKMNVDKVLDTDQKQSFYSNQSSYVSNMIENFTPTKEANKAPAGAGAGYGQLALNKTVNSKQSPAPVSSAPKNSESFGLDDFLKTPSKNSNPRATSSYEEVRPEPTAKEKQRQEEYQRELYRNNDHDNDTVDNEELLTELENYQKRVEELERHLFDLSKQMERIDRREPEGIFQLRNILKTLDVADNYIHRIIKSATFDLSREELENPEVVFEFALKDMLQEVPTGMPLFSSCEDTPVVTVLISETSCGQSSMLQKIGALKDDCVLIKNGDPKDVTDSFTDKVFNLKIKHVKGIGEIVSECRKSLEAGQTVFIDYRAMAGEANETKKFLDGLRRSFEKVEVLITLSAIHTELYNRKVVSRYSQLADGIVISHLDLCLNFGSLFNLSLTEKRLPFKFFGTGEVVPDDLEAATAERILAGIFQFE